MWRLFQAVPRAIRQQFNGSFRSAYHEEEVRRSSVTEEGIHAPLPVQINRDDVKLSVQRRPHHWHDWHDRKRGFCRGPWWFCQPHLAALEAVGLGAAIVLGIQLSHFYNEQERAEHEHRRRQLSVAHLLCRQAFRTGSAAKGVCDGHSSSSGVPTYVDTGQPSEGAGSQGSEALNTEDTDVLDFGYPSSRPQSRSTQETLQSASPTKPQQEDAAPENATAEFEALISSYTGLVQHRLGMHHMRGGRLSEAVGYWSQASLTGMAKANYNMALCYELGKGTEKNLMKAVEHYSLAAAEGHSRALYNLAVLHLLGQGTEKNPQRAMLLLGKAAEQGLKQAQTQLGVLYTAEERKDMKKAASLFNMAAEQKDSKGLYYLGICYEQGWGVGQNQCKAAELYSQASRLGHTDSTHNLAVFFEQGLGGMPEDWDTAAQLYSEAAQAGCVQAKQSLRHLEVKQRHRHSSMEETQKQSMKNTDSTVSSPAFTEYVRQHLVDFGVPNDWDSEETPSPKLAVSKTSKKSTELKFDSDKETLDIKHEEDMQQQKSVAVKFYLGGELLELNQDSEDDQSEYSYTNLDEAPSLLPPGTWGDYSHLSIGQRSCSLTQLSKQSSFQELNFVACT